MFIHNLCFEKKIRKISQYFLLKIVIFTTNFAIHCIGMLMYLHHNSKLNSLMLKPAFCICENKGADQLCGNLTADQRLIFATQMVQSLYFLNLKFQATSHLYLYTAPVCVGPGQKCQRQA